MKLQTRLILLMSSILVVTGVVGGGILIYLQSRNLESHFQGAALTLAQAVLIPLEQIRERCMELDKDILYVCYCLNGRQSSTAAFLLRQRAFKVGVLRGGVQSLQRAGIV